MSRRAIGWALLILVWAGVGLRWLYPGDLHAGYEGLLGLAIRWIDALFITPPWFLLELVMAAPDAPWAYLAGTALYLLGLSLLIYFFLIRKRAA